VEYFAEVIALHSLPPRLGISFAALSRNGL
jgi:hypothetical protein